MGTVRISLQEDVSNQDLDDNQIGSLCGRSRDSKVIKPASDSPSTRNCCAGNVPFWNPTRLLDGVISNLNLTKKWAETDKQPSLSQPGIPQFFAGCNSERCFRTGRVRVSAATNRKRRTLPLRPARLPGSAPRVVAPIETARHRDSGRSLRRLSPGSSWPSKPWSGSEKN